VKDAMPDLSYLPESLKPLATPVEELKSLEGNPRRGDVEAVAKSLAKFGQRKPIVINSDGTVLAGNHTLAAARELMWTHLAAVRVDDDDATAKAYALADNRTGQLGGFDEADLAQMMADVADVDPELLEAASYTEAEMNRLLESLNEAAGDDDDPVKNPSLADRFLIPPFSVFDARQGWWRKRKAAWMEVGLRSEIGRDDLLAFNSVSSNPDYYDQKNAVERKLRRKIDHNEFQAEHYIAKDRASQANGTSVFDPVLAELLYRWFCPANGLILDPWAGGSVRGLIAAMLGRRYYGIELRPEQVKANREQASTALHHVAEMPVWREGDSRRVLADMADTAEEYADFLIGCPPYFDLETYSDDEADLSNMNNEQFAEAYHDTIANAARNLKNDRFAAIIVSSVRKKQRGGPLRDLHGLTVDACQAAGLSLYNEAILLTIAGSLPIRTGKMFVGTRALGRTHQDVLIFCKGDAKKATAACGDVDVEAMAEALSMHERTGGTIRETDDDAFIELA
jgi:DNA modification methylase